MHWLKCNVLSEIHEKFGEETNIFVQYKTNSLKTVHIKLGRRNEET